MPRPNKIEQHDCVDIVREGMEQGKSTRQIAKECSEKAGVDISHTTVARYLETLNVKVKKEKLEVIKQDRRRVIRQVKADYDIIQSQLDVSHRMYEQLLVLDDLPGRLDRMQLRMEEAVAEAGEVSPKTVQAYFKALKGEILNHLQELALINREVRENNKFLTALQEKIYDFSLVQEFIEIFMTEFEQEDRETFARVMQRITANPKMAELVREQRRRKGEEE